MRSNSSGSIGPSYGSCCHPKLDLQLIEEVAVAVVVAAVAVVVAAVAVVVVCVVIVVVALVLFMVVVTTLSLIYNS